MLLSGLLELCCVMVKGSCWSRLWSSQRPPSTGKLLITSGFPQRRARHALACTDSRMSSRISVLIVEKSSTATPHNFADEPERTDEKPFSVVSLNRSGSRPVCRRSRRRYPQWSVIRIWPETDESLSRSPLCEWSMKSFHPFHSLPSQEASRSSPPSPPSPAGSAEGSWAPLCCSAL